MAPPKNARNKKGEVTINPGHIVPLPRAAPETVEVAHPTTLPSFLVASSLFLLASHSRCSLEPVIKDHNKSANNDSNINDTQQQSPIGKSLGSGRGKNAAAAAAKSPFSPAATKRGGGGAAAGGKGHGAGGDHGLDVAAAATPRSAPSWNLVVNKRSIFECAGLIGDLAGEGGSNDNNNRPTSPASALSFSSSQGGHQPQAASGSSSAIDFNKVTSFAAFSSAHHALVLVRDERGAQRVFVGGSNDEGQLPLPIALEQRRDTGVVVSRSSTPVFHGNQNNNHLVNNNNTNDQSMALRKVMPVADTAAVPFRELHNLEFKIVSTPLFGSDPTSNGGSSAVSTVSRPLVATARALLTQGDEARRRVAAAAAAAQQTATTVLRHHADGADIVSAACGAAHTVVLVRNPHARRDAWGAQPATYLFGCGRADAIGTGESSARPEQNSFRHLPVGDGEDFDALWAFGDLTYGRCRRGLVVFGTIRSSEDSRTKYHSPTRAQVVIPAPLGCLVREVITLNAVGDHKSATYVYVENNSSSSSSSNDISDDDVFDGARLLVVHTAFPSGRDGDLKMLHPPAPIFSYADVTDRVFGSVASTLRKMGAPCFRLKKLCCGSEHAVGVTVDGAVIGFGSNHFGQLGESAGGAERGPNFADEIGVGPRSARMYPTPDCSMVPPKLYKQYYESAVMLRPPSLRRSALVLAAAHAQLKGRTVEFNEVVSVVPIPAIDHSAKGAAANAAADLDDGGEDGGADGEFEGGGDQNESLQQGKQAQQQQQSSSPKLYRRNTGLPTKAGSLSPPGKQRSVTATPGKSASPDHDQQQQQDGEQQQNNNNITAVMNPAWPHATVVDCCCGPLFTALMQADAQLVLLGDHLPPVIAAATAEHNAPAPQKEGVNAMF